MSQITIDTSKLETVGDNVKAAVQDGKLILVIDANETIGPSSTGKMMGTGSTSGFVAIVGGYKLNLYLGKPQNR